MIATSMCFFGILKLPCAHCFDGNWLELYEIQKQTNIGRALVHILAAQPSDRLKHVFLTLVLLVAAGVCSVIRNLSV